MKMLILLLSGFLSCSSFAYFGFEENHYQCTSTDTTFNLTLDLINRPDIELQYFDSTEPSNNDANGSINYLVIKNNKVINANFKSVSATVGQSSDTYKPSLDGKQTCLVGQYTSGIVYSADVLNRGSKEDN